MSAAFLEGVRGAIPGADLQMTVMGKIVQLWCDTPTHILDLGCGNGILGRFLLNIFPAAHGVFIDFSEPMLEAARKNLSNLLRTSIFKGDFSTPQWIDVVQPYRPFDIIVSGFAIHHQPDDRKKALYSEIFNLLAAGGIFLNLDHVTSETAPVAKLFEELFVDNLQDFHARSDPAASRQEIADIYYKRPDKKENILAPVEEQCRWLRDLGYRDVDCFFKIFELALFGGRKASKKA
ncbi:MAG: class I SAM-dependent methyltransferase [Desulfobacterales bacterium]